MNWSVLADLAAQFSVVSLLSIGGANAVLPEVHLRAVELAHWLSDEEFRQMYALSQAAPGPNVLFVSLVGWQAAGPLGGVVAMAAMCGPSSLLTWQVARAWERFRDAPLRIAIERGLMPVTVGLVLSSAYVVTRTVDHEWTEFALTAITLAVTLATRWHPLWLLGAAGVLGAFALG